MDIVEHLRRIPLFGHLSTDSLLLLAGIAIEHTVRRGVPLSYQANLGTSLFIIDGGEAIIQRVDEKGIRQTMDTLRAGDYFGVTSLFLGEPRDATVIAITEMRVWTISRADFDRLLATHPQVRRALRVPETIIQKLRAPRYTWLTPGEFVVWHDHRHWYAFAHSIFFSTGVTLAYFAFIAWMTSTGRFVLDWRIWILPVLLLYLPLLIWHWVDWRNDYFVVTTQRVSHQERIAFIYESREQATIDRVQNVKITLKTLGSLLGFGDVAIATAVETTPVKFTMVPRPEKARDVIMEQVARATAVRRAVQRQQIRGDLVTHLNLHSPGPAPLEPEQTAESPVSQITRPQRPENEPGIWAKTMHELIDLGVLPWIRRETEDSITWRKHWIFLIREAAPALLLAGAGLVITIVAVMGQPAWLLSSLPALPLLSLLGTIAAGAWCWWQVTNWGNDIYVVTGERIIDIEKKPLFFAEERRDASLGNIQNVSFKIHNPFASALNYGDVIAQTAGVGDFTFDGVPNPSEVSREIFRRVQIFKDKQRQKDNAARRAELAEWFSIYRELEKAQPGGVAFLDPAGGWRFYSTKQGLINDSVRAIAVGPGDVLWFATSEGVSKLTRSGGQDKWESFTSANGLVNNDVRSVAVASDGSAWFGTHSGASHLTAQGQWESFTAPDLLPGPLVSALAIGPDHSIWFGTDQGAARLAPDGSWLYFDTTVGLVHDHILSILVTGDGVVWFGTLGGVSRLTPDSMWRDYTRANGLAADTVLNVALGPDGSLWFGTNFGTSRLAIDGTWENFTTQDGLAGNYVWAITPTPDDRLWFGTNAGASRLNPDGAWRTYTVRDGLPAEEVRAIAATPDGAVWFA